MKLICRDIYWRKYGTHNPNFLHEVTEQDGKKLCIHCKEDITELYDFYIPADPPYCQPSVDL